MTIEETFAIPGFKAKSEWTNSWRISNSSIVTSRLDEFGYLHVDKSAKYPMHFMLNSESKDLKGLEPDRGIALDDEKTFMVSAEGNEVGRVKAQVAIHEFETDGTSLRRHLIPLGQQALYVAGTDVARLVITLRAVGTGRFTLRGLEFQPTGRVRSADPGIHHIGDAPVTLKHQDIQTFDELKDFWLQDEQLRLRIASTSAEQLSPLLRQLLKEQQRLHREVAGLADQNQQLLEQLGKIRSYLGRQELREAFISTSGVEVSYD